MVPDRVVSSLECSCTDSYIDLISAIQAGYREFGGSVCLGFFCGFVCFLLLFWGWGCFLIADIASDFG